jgi:hypothetical protein
MDISPLVAWSSRANKVPVYNPCNFCREGRRITTTGFHASQRKFRFMRNVGMNVRKRGIHLLCFTLVLLTSSPSEADSYCPGCKAAVIGTAVALGTGIGLAIYFVHRSHTSLTGCVEQTEHGLSLTAKDGKNYALADAPSEVKAQRRLQLRGHKISTNSGRVFRVDRLSRDYGACGVWIGLRGSNASLCGSLALRSPELTSLSWMFLAIFANAAKSFLGFISCPVLNLSM